MLQRCVISNSLRFTIFHVARRHSRTNAWSSPSGTSSLPSNALGALATHDQEVLPSASELANALKKNHSKDWQIQHMSKTSVEGADVQKVLMEMQEARLEMKSLIEETRRERLEVHNQVEQLTRDVEFLLEQLKCQNIGYRERVQRQGKAGLGADSRAAWRPTIEVAMRQPAHVSELGHESLAELAMQGNHNAHRERLLREVMCVDGVSWEEAHKVLAKMDVYKERYYWLESAPYRLGMAGALVAAVAATLLVFCKPFALAYGTQVAGEDLPDGVEIIDQMTTNQVGTWTWSWMEPMIGTASFVLLCCQFTRAQVLKINMKPYGEYILQWRADRLANKFSQYDRSMVRAWAKHMPRVGVTFQPKYERQGGFRGPTSGL